MPYKIDEPRMRAGWLHRAVNVHPTTMRSWPLSLGSVSGGGHPRYSDFDALCAGLMVQLTSGQKVAAGVAGRAIDNCRVALATAFTGLRQEFAAEKRWRRIGAPFFVVYAGRPELDGAFGNPGVAPSEVVDREQFEQLLMREDYLGSFIVVPLPAIYAKIRMQLDLLSAGEITAGSTEL